MIEFIDKMVETLSYKLTSASKLEKQKEDSINRALAAHARCYVSLSNRVLDRIGLKKAHIKVSSEVIFYESSYVNEQKALVDELNRSFTMPQGGLHDRRELDDWLEESSLHGDVAEATTQGMCDGSDSDWASLRDGFASRRESPRHSHRH